jgi:hypothetical protein
MEPVKILDKRERLDWKYDSAADVLYVSVGVTGKVAARHLLSKSAPDNVLFDSRARGERAGSPPKVLVRIC